MKKSTKASNKGKHQSGLILMGGGARGFAHIGVLDVFQRNGLIPETRNK